MNDTYTVFFTHYMSPCGLLTLGEHRGELCMCDWGPRGRDVVRRRLAEYGGTHFKEVLTPLLEEATRQLDEYFARKRQAFDLPLRLRGTLFQKRVWKVLRDVPYGTRATYTDIAKAMGEPRSVRVVASSIGVNPVSIIVPCHRIIGIDGTLRGYAGGCVAKEFLLQLESEKPE